MKKNFILILIIIPILLFSDKILVPRAVVSVPIFANKNIEVITYTDVMMEVLPKILKEEVDYAIIPTNIAVKLYNRGQNIHIIGFPRVKLLFLITNEPDIHSVKDFNNKEIYIGSKGSSPDVISSYIFKKNKVLPIVSYSSSQEIAKLYIAGKIKSAVLPEPLCSFADLKSGRKNLVIDLTKEFDKSEFIPQVCLISLKNKTIDLSSYYDKINFEEFYQLSIQNKVFEMDKHILKLAFQKCDIGFINTQDVEEEFFNYLKILLKNNPKSIGDELPERDILK